MRGITGILGLSLVLLAPAAAQAQDDGGYGPTGTRIKTSTAVKHPKPIPREDLDKVVTKMFQETDGNRDGMLTLDEFNANVAARKEAVIAARFARVDSDRNGSVSAAEFAAWQRSLGSIILSDRQDLPGESLVPDELPVDPPGRERADVVVARLIKPLSANAIVEANADYDTGASLPELLEFEHKDFDQADLNKDGWLTYDEVDFLEERQSGTAGVSGGFGVRPGGAPEGGPPPPPGN